MLARLAAQLPAARFLQFTKFCVVGGSGIFVDMGVLFLLADPRCLGLNITLSKLCSAEAAMARSSAALARRSGSSYCWPQFGNRAPAVCSAPAAAEKSRAARCTAAFFLPAK